MYPDSDSRSRSRPPANLEDIGIITVREETCTLAVARLWVLAELSLRWVGRGIAMSKLLPPYAAMMEC